MGSTKFALFEQAASDIMREWQSCGEIADDDVLS